MSITMAQLKKNLKTLDERVDRLHKSETFTDGAVEDKFKQLETRSGSGQTGNVPEHTMTDGSFIDGAQKDGIERGMNSKAGSGATVSEEFLTRHTGRHFNDGTVDKEEMQKQCAMSGKRGGNPMRGANKTGGTPMRGTNKTGKGDFNPPKKASTAKVPRPTTGKQFRGGDDGGKTTTTVGKKVTTTRKK
jgi:hypothetical protein